MERILGLDYGARRIGLAIADEALTVAVPAGILDTKAVGDIFLELRRIVDDRSVTTIVVGLPIGLNGRETEQTGTTRRFAETVRERLGIPVELSDERFTSVEAGVTHRRGRPDDAAAATIMLQSYLDRLRHRRPS